MRDEVGPTEVDKRGKGGNRGGDKVRKAKEGKKCSEKEGFVGGARWKEGT